MNGKTILTLAALAAAGCTGLWYFDAGIQGRVVDRDDGQGINEAVVALYTQDPASEGATVLLRTITLDNNAQGGYYSFDKFFWETDDPMFGEFGDRGRIWLVISHKDYQAVTRWTDLISDTNSVLPEIELTRAYYYATLEGEVIDADFEVRQSA